MASGDLGDDDDGPGFTLLSFLNELPGFNTAYIKLAPALGGATEVIIISALFLCLGLVFVVTCFLCRRFLRIRSGYSSVNDEYGNPDVVTDADDLERQEILAAVYGLRQGDDDDLDDLAVDGQEDDALDRAWEAIRKSVETDDEPFGLPEDVSVRSGDGRTLGNFAHFSPAYRLPGGEGTRGEFFDISDIGSRGVGSAARTGGRAPEIVDAIVEF